MTATHSKTRRWWYAVVVIVALLLVSGCHSESKAGPSSAPTSTSSCLHGGQWLSAKRFEGPLSWMARAQLSVAFQASRGGVVYDHNIDLVNKGKIPLVLDKVVITPQPCVAQPVLKAANVAPAGANSRDPVLDALNGRLPTVKGYKVPPMRSLLSDQHPPILVLTLGAPSHAPFAWNQDFLVYYHLEGQTRGYIAKYDERDVICINGRTNPVCWEKIPEDWPSTKEVVKS